MAPPPATSVDYSEVDITKPFTEIDDRVLFDAIRGCESPSLAKFNLLVMANPFADHENDPLFPVDGLYACRHGTRQYGTSHQWNYDHVEDGNRKAYVDYANMSTRKDVNGDEDELKVIFKCKFHPDCEDFIAVNAKQFMKAFIDIIKNKVPGYNRFDNERPDDSADVNRIRRMVDIVLDSQLLNGGRCLENASSISWQGAYAVTRHYSSCHRYQLDRWPTAATYGILVGKKDILTRAKQRAKRGTNEAKAQQAKVPRMSKAQRNGSARARRGDTDTADAALNDLVHTGKDTSVGGGKPGSV